MGKENMKGADMNNEDDKMWELVYWGCVWGGR